MSTASAPEGDKPRALDLKEVKQLENLIRRSFRVRDTETPVYVDVAGNLDRVGLSQHQIVFGRRGSGKSCLLVYYRREVAEKQKIPTVYMQGDTIKTLDYPDVLIRLLLAAFEGLPRDGLFRRAGRWVRRKKSPRDEVVAELRTLLKMPGSAKLVVTEGQVDGSTRGASGGGAAGPANAKVEAGRSRERSRQEVRESDERKVQTIENRLADYIGVLQGVIERAKFEYAVFIIDDFYLINPRFQPEVIDYLHRLLRDTRLYLKIGTVRHRTSLLRTSPLHYGVQPFQDIDGFNLDRTLEDLDQTGAYLEGMLREMGSKVGVTDAPGLMSEDARKDLILLSGGVPRDYLNIFVGGLERARDRPARRRVTPTDLRQAAASLAQETKFRDLRTDAGSEVPALEALFVDLVTFCLEEKRTTAFLVSKDQIATEPAVHELLQQLMDFKLVHLVEPSTSAASGRPGRYEAYTLDFALFMEPRRRNIEIVRFWETDDQRRRVRLREAPVYDLARGNAALEADGEIKAEDALKIVDRLDEDTSADPPSLF